MRTHSKEERNYFVMCTIGGDWWALNFVSFHFFRCTRNGYIYPYSMYWSHTERICRKNSERKAYLWTIFCEIFTRVCLRFLWFSFVLVLFRFIFCVFFSPHLSESKANVMRSKSKLCAKDEYQLVFFISKLYIIFLHFKFWNENRCTCCVNLTQFVLPQISH